MQPTGPTLSIAAALTAASLLASPVRAQSARASPEMIDVAQAEALRPGQWVWTPDISPRGPVVIYVDLSRQLVSVYRNGARIGVSTISSGRRGYETPAGIFTVLERDIDHRSRKYHDAPMPYMVRLTWDGVALHGGHVGARPASHGCIRLPMAFAREMYRVASIGSTVVVVGAAGAPPETPSAGALAPVGVDGAREQRMSLPMGRSFSWTPQAAGDGPVTIVASTTDQYVVVLRNGVEIGRARASIPLDTTTPRLLTRSDNGQWTYVTPPGQENAAASDPAALIARVRLDPQFQAAMESALTPGSTMLLTDASVAGEAVADVALDTHAPVVVGGSAVSVDEAAPLERSDDLVDH
jgi:hypothetical protein